MAQKVNVEKFGSSLVASRDGGVYEAKLSNYARGMVDRYALTDGTTRQGLVIVTSGARATGVHLTDGLGYLDGQLTDEQLSGVGFAPVFAAWQSAFSELGVAVASTGVTHNQLGGGRWWHKAANRQERRLLVESIRHNMTNGVVTVVNESDMISNTELIQLITGGDNDGLAATVAIMLGADRLVIRTEGGGLVNNQHKLIQRLGRHNHGDILHELKFREKSKTGRGGIEAKVSAGWQAACKGVDEVVISGVGRHMSYADETMIRAA